MALQKSGKNTKQSLMMSQNDWFRPEVRFDPTFKEPSPALTSNQG
jgi:hypothetical protein